MPKEKKYHFIYKTTNVLTERYYFGMHSTDDLDDGYLGSGQRLWYSIRKYGKENHKREITEFCKNRMDLIQREIEIVNLNEVAKEDCMNLKIGGEGNSGHFGGKALADKLKNDKEFRKIIGRQRSLNAKKRYDSGLNKNFKCDQTGRNHTEETKKQMSESHKGKHIGKLNSQYETCWTTKDNNNKKIKKEELDRYLNQGWIKGRKIK
jgi:hypothetical protein